MSFGAQRAGGHYCINGAAVAQLDDQGSIPGRGNDEVSFSSPPRADRPWGPRASYPKGKVGSLPGGKAARA
jgi:hypothetical protein